MALEFLKATLKQDSIVAPAFSAMEQLLLRDSTDSQLLIKYLPTLDIAFLTEYHPFMETNRDSLIKEAKNKNWTTLSSAPAEVTKNVDIYRAAFSGFQNLYQSKQRLAQGTDFDAYESAIDSLFSYFDSLQLKPIPPSPRSIIKNPFWGLLDTIIQYQYFDSLRAAESLIDIGEGIDKLRLKLNTNAEKGKDIVS